MWLKEIPVVYVHISLGFSFVTFSPPSSLIACRRILPSSLSIFIPTPPHLLSLPSNNNRTFFFFLFQPQWWEYNIIQMPVGKVKLSKLHERKTPKGKEIICVVMYILYSINIFLYSNFPLLLILFYLPGGVESFSQHLILFIFFFSECQMALIISFLVVVCVWRNEFSFTPNISVARSIEYVNERINAMRKFCKKKKKHFVERFYYYLFRPFR